MGCLGRLTTPALAQGRRGKKQKPQRRQTVGFSWLTLGYAFTPSLLARAQTYIYTAFYGHSGIEALGGTAVQGALGFEWRVLSRSSL